MNIKTKDFNKFMAERSFEISKLGHQSRGIYYADYKDNTILKSSKSTYQMLDKGNVVVNIIPPALYCDTLGRIERIVKYRLFGDIDLKGEER